MCWSSCKSSFHRDYECIQTGTIFRPNILAYKWRSMNVGNSGGRELDNTVNSISKIRHSARRKRRCKETKSPSLTICADQGCLIQERFLSSIPEVFKQWGSRLRNERSSREDLQKSLRGAVASAKVDPSWVLLAHYAQGRPSLHQGLRQVSEVQ